MSDAKAPWLEAARHHAQTLADLARVTAERDEAIEALQRLEPYGKDAAPNELEGATALAGLDPGTYWRTRHQLLRAEIRKACAILSKHPQKVTT